VNTYIKRELCTIINVENLITFERFMKACAVRSGQLLNLTSIAEDLEIAESTVSTWLSVLEATYVIFLLQPYQMKIPKRLVKSPKLFFSDTGLACSLLGIRTVDEVLSTYLRESLIETAIISDLYKQYCAINYNPSDLYYFRTSGGQEVDAIIDKAPHPIAVEIKSGQTINPDFFRGIVKWHTITKIPKGSDYIIYGGDAVQRWPDATVLGWQSSGHLVKDVLIGDSK
jgi:predicted AAA+ superfamily ATPase